MAKFSHETNTVVAFSIAGEPQTDLPDSPGIADEVTISSGRLPGDQRRSLSSSHAIALQAELATHNQLWQQRAALGLIVIDTDERIVQWNAYARDLLVADQLYDQSKALTDFIAPCDRQRLEEFIAALFAGKLMPYLDVKLGRDGQDAADCWVRLTPTSVAMNSIALSICDITELRTLELEKQFLRDQVRQLQRLELLYELSVGVVHDFKNTLQVMEAYGSLLSADLIAAGRDDKNAQ